MSVQTMKQITNSLRTASPRLRRGLQGGLALGAMLAVGACDTQRLVRVTDPDIITPELVQTAAAADFLRVGVIGRLQANLTAGEGMLTYSGMLSDEYESGDTFIERNQMDQRNVQIENGNLDGGYRGIQRIRVGAQQALRALIEFDEAGPGWKKAEMLMVEAYAVNLIAEHFCSGVPLSTVVDGVEQPGGPVSTAQMYALALAKYDSALTFLGNATTADANRVRNIVRVERGRTLLNLNRPADAAAAVAGVPTTFVWNLENNATAGLNNVHWNFNINVRRYLVGNSEAGEGLNFFAANDPRLRTCLGGDATCRAAGITNTAAFNNAPGLRIQLKYPTRETAIGLVNGVQARMIEAEAQLRAGDAAASLATLNAARAAFPALALPALTDAGSQDARIDQVFREKAFWNWGLGTRLGDLRRLIRQYNRPAASVFPSGAYSTPGLTYGTDVNFPIPQSERNNPEFGENGSCIDRNA